MNFIPSLNSLYLIVIMMCTIIMALYANKDDKRKTRKEKSMLPEITRIQLIKEDIYCFILNHSDKPVTLYNVYLASKYLPFFKRKATWFHITQQDTFSSDYYSINLSYVIIDSTTIIIKRTQRAKNTIKILLDTSVGISSNSFKLPTV